MYDWKMEKVTELLFHAALAKGVRSDLKMSEEAMTRVVTKEMVNYCARVMEDPPREQEVAEKIQEMMPAVLSLRDALLRSVLPLIENLWTTRTVVSRLLQRDPLRSEFLGAVQSILKDKVDKGEILSKEPKKASSALSDRLRVLAEEEDVEFLHILSDDNRSLRLLLRINDEDHTLTVEIPSDIEGHEGRISAFEGVFTTTLSTYLKSLESPEDPQEERTYNVKRVGDIYFEDSHCLTFPELQNLLAAQKLPAYIAGTGRTDTTGTTCLPANVVVAAQ